MRRFILIFMALLFHVVSYPQKVTQSSYCYKDRKGIVYVRKYIVYNNTKEDLLTWISPVFVIGTPKFQDWVAISIKS